MITEEWFKESHTNKIKASEDEVRDANLKAEQLLKLPISTWKTTDVPCSVSIAYLVDSIDRKTGKLEKFICFCELKKDTEFEQFCFIMSIGTTIKHVYGWKEVGE
jgi:hypothetical protein